MTAGCNFHNQLLFIACCLITVGWIKANSELATYFVLSTDCTWIQNEKYFNFIHLPACLSFCLYLVLYYLALSTRVSFNSVFQFKPTSGIYFGMLTCEYLKMKPYHWRGMWNIPSYRGKMKRIVSQFTPYCWVPFEWKPTQSLGRWLAILGVIVLVRCWESKAQFTWNHVVDIM